MGMGFKAGWLCLCVISVTQPSWAVHDDELFALSLEELGHIKVIGAAVRNLNLDYVPYSNNPFALHNLKIPAAIDVIDHRTIEARGLNNVVEVVESMVGVLSGESPSEPYSFSTRGFTRNSIAVLYDGVSMGVSSLNMRPQTTFNLDRVEVVKGASVLDATFGSTGGTVNMITKKPIIDKQTLDVHTRYGRFNTQSYNLGVNASANAYSAYRFDVNSNSSDGWVDDTASDSLNTSASYLYKPASNVNILFYSSYTEDNLPAYWGTPLVPMDVAQNPSNDVVSTDDDRVVDLATRYNNYNVADNVIDSQSYWLRLDMDWQLSDQTQIKASLYQFSADRLWENAEKYTYDPAAQNIIRDRFLIDHQRYVRGVNVSLTHEFYAWGKLQNIAFNIISSVNDFSRDVGFGVTPLQTINIYSVDLFEPLAGSFGDVNKRKDKETSIIDAAVVQHSIYVRPAWRIDSKVRFERTYYDRLYVNFDDSTRARSSLDKQFNQQSYFIGSVYELLADTFFYGNFAKQHNPIEDGLLYFYDLSNLEPSKTQQYEVGLKSILNTNTELSLALYHIENRQKYQVGMNDDVDESKLTSQGLEFALKHNVSKQLRFGGNYAYVDAQYDDYYDPFVGRDVGDNDPVNVPEHMLSAWLSVNDILGVPMEWGFGYNYVSSRYANTENSVKLKSYQLWNAFMAYEASNYRIALSVRNITDEVYAPWSDVFYPDQVALGSPRMGEASLRIHF